MRTGCRRSVRGSPVSTARIGDIDNATTKRRTVQASEMVLEVAGGAWNASLNHYGTGGNCLVTTVHVDESVYVVGQEDFAVAKYTLEGWLGGADQADPPVIECGTAGEAWELLRLVREGCLVWQCGACDAWIFTSNRPRVGVLRCSTCQNGGVDFRHGDRHIGGSDT